MPFTVGQYLTANDLKSQEDAHTLGNGVVNGLKVIPEAPPSMDIEVEIGKAYVADTLVVKGAVTTLTVGGADPTNPRKDIVVCNSVGTLSIVAGTPEAALPSDKVGVYTLNPEPPDIPANSIILAEIWVPADAASISGSEIYDKRVSIADFLTHKDDASAHHAKFTTVEHTAIGNAAPHHTKYTDIEAQNTVKANVEVGDLRAPTRDLVMNNQNITGVNSITAVELHGTTYWGDVHFEDVKCPLCRINFKKGDKVILMVNLVKEKSISAFPIHLKCGGG